MKKLLYYTLLLFAGFSLNACDDDDDNELTVFADRTEIAARVSGGSYEVRVRSNGTWQAEVKNATQNEWITLSKSSGESGEETVEINIAPYQSQSSVRTALVQISAGAAREIITVTQYPASGTSKRFDKLSLSKYFGDEYNKNADFVQIVLRSGAFDINDTPSGEAYILSLGCQVDMPADPERAQLSPGTYTLGNKTEGKPNTFLLNEDGKGTYLETYDAEGNKKMFNIAEGSEFNVRMVTENNYVLSGQFVDETGNTFEWSFEGYIKFQNVYFLTTDVAGYTILRSEGLQSARYEGNVDGTETGRIVLDVRDPLTSKGMNLVFYVEQPPEKKPNDALLTPGEYTVKNGGAVKNIMPGEYIEETSSVAGSFSYFISGGQKYAEYIINEGSFKVSWYNDKEYDIVFDLKGVNSDGKQEEVTKYRYIGPLTFEDKQPQSYTVNPVSYMKGEYYNEDSYRRYRIILGTSSNAYEKNSQHIYLEFYGELPSDPGSLEIPTGTYTLGSLNNYVPYKYIPGYIPSFNPKGTFFINVQSNGAREFNLAYKGTFTITKTDQGYAFDIDLLTKHNVSAVIAFTTLKWEGEIPLSENWF